MWKFLYTLYFISWYDAKNKYLLFLLKSIKFRVLLTYSKYSNYTTWRSFNSTRFPHTFDNFICSLPLFCRIKDLKVVNIGVCSNHTDILTILKITEINFKATDKIVSQTNWKLIGYHNLKNELFNNSLYKSISGRTKYSNYNRHILEDDNKTATINIQKNKGWFHFRCNSLLPLIKERDALLSDYRTLYIVKGDLSEAKLWPRFLQISVYDVIAFAKPVWPVHQAEKIHSMRFNHKEKWQSVRVLSGGDTSYHASPTIMRVRLPKG